MAQVDFYHLQNQTLENILPRLLEKAYSTGKKIVVKIGNEERVEFINSTLWTYNDQSFLPHGSKKDGFGEEQPIWLTAGNDVPNGAEFLFLVDGALIPAAEAENFERIFNIFDGNVESAVVQARNFWKDLKQAGCNVNYWQQDSAGKWTKKA